MDQIEEIKNKIDIVGLIQGYVPLKKAGRNFKGNCPFHSEKTPSFMVNPELQIFKCFGCGAGGDAYSFLQKIEGMEFGEALQQLADRVGVKLVSYKPTQGEQLKEKLVAINFLAGEVYHWLLTKNKLGSKALAYVKSRGISDEAILKFKLGYAPDAWDYLSKFLLGKKGYKREDVDRAGLMIKNYDRFRNRIMFPLANQRGQVVGFAGRVLPGADEKSGGKYVNTAETEIYHKGELLYGLDITRSEIKTAGFAVVVEGEIDAIASWQAGVKNVVAIKGSALTEKQVELLRRLCDTLVLALDTDLAGDAASRRGIEIADRAGMSIKVARLEGAKDPGELAIIDPEAWKKVVGEAIPVYDFYIDSAVNRFGLEVGGKKRIGQEIVPILSKIEDEIIKAHYIKKLARTLGVEENDIRTQMVKVSTKQPVVDKKEETEMKKSRMEVVEEYLLELALKRDKIADLPELKDEFWAKVASELKSGQTVNQLSPELRERTQELLLREGDFDDKEWQKALSQWEELSIREEIADNEGDVRGLIKRLGELTKSR